MGGLAIYTNRLCVFQKHGNIGTRIKIGDGSKRVLSYISTLQSFAPPVYTTVSSRALTVALSFLGDIQCVKLCLDGWRSWSAGLVIIGLPRDHCSVSQSTSEQYLVPSEVEVVVRCLMRWKGVSKMPTRPMEIRGMSAHLLHRRSAACSMFEVPWSQDEIHRQQLHSCKSERPRRTVNCYAVVQ